MLVLALEFSRGSAARTRGRTSPPGPPNKPKGIKARTAARPGHARGERSTPAGTYALPHPRSSCEHGSTQARQAGTTPKGTSPGMQPKGSLPQNGIEEPDNTRRDRSVKGGLRPPHRSEAIRGGQSSAGIREQPNSQCSTG